MIKKIIGLFPGQGSQKVGMGLELHKTSELARSLFAAADETLGFPLSTYCFEGPFEKLTLTEVTQPAILTVSVICLELFKKSALGQLALVAAAGHSLGEYSALVAAGALSFADAIMLVHKRGKYMQEAVPAGEGKMAAVLGKDLKEIEEALAKVTKGVAQVANINAPGQIVIAGDKAAIEEGLAILAPVKSIDLPVSAPFHCALMRPAQEKLAADLKLAAFHPCAFPVYANFTAKPVVQPEEIRTTLERQVCGRVKWVESMQNAIAETTPDLAVEFGAGTALTGMLKRINPAITRVNVDSLEGIEQFKSSLS
jgi:[acyl-carrier-protein] S-malonyltransferase